MSLKEAYQLAHTAECRLRIEASRPDRNLRFLVGHLLHYENLRLRIVEIEHDVTRAVHSSAVSFRGATDHTSRLHNNHKSSPLSRKSPPPSVNAIDDTDTYQDEELDADDPWSDDEMDDEDDEDAGLGLQRFPSAAAQPRPTTTVSSHDSEPSIRPTPALPDPDPETLAQTLQGNANSDLTRMYNSVRKCPCHGVKDAPAFERVWELPPDSAAKVKGVNGDEFVRMAVAEVAAG